MDALIKFMQQAEKTAPVLATKTISIECITGHVDDLDAVIEKTKKELQKLIPYNVERSYDCKGMAKTVLDKISNAKACNESTITLENRCCVNNDCPKMRFMCLFVKNIS